MLAFEFVVDSTFVLKLTGLESSLDI